MPKRTAADFARAAVKRIFRDQKIPLGVIPEEKPFHTVDRQTALSLFKDHCARRKNGYQAVMVFTDGTPADRSWEVASSSRINDLTYALYVLWDATRHTQAVHLTVHETRIDPVRLVGVLRHVIYGPKLDLRRMIFHRERTYVMNESWLTDRGMAVEGHIREVSSTFGCYDSHLVESRKPSWLADQRLRIASSTEDREKGRRGNTKIGEVVSNPTIFFVTDGKPEHGGGLVREHQLVEDLSFGAYLQYSTDHPGMEISVSRLIIDEQRKDVFKISGTTALLNHGFDPGLLYEILVERDKAEPLQDGRTYIIPHRTLGKLPLAVPNK